MTLTARNIVEKWKQWFPQTVKSDDSSIE